MAGINITPRATPTPNLPVTDPATGGIPLPTVNTPQQALVPAATRLFDSANNNFNQGNYAAAAGNAIGGIGAGVGGAIAVPALTVAGGLKAGADAVGQGIANFSRGIVGLAPATTLTPAPAAAVAAPAVSAGQGAGLTGDAAISYFNSPAAAAARASIAPAAAVTPNQQQVEGRGQMPYSPLSTAVTAPAVRFQDAEPGTAGYHANIISLAGGGLLSQPSVSAEGTAGQVSGGAPPGGTGGILTMDQLPQALALGEFAHKDAAQRQLLQMNQADAVNAAQLAPGETSAKDPKYLARQVAARAALKLSLQQQTGGIGALVQSQALGNQ